jgi:IS1 family transposase
MVWKAEELPSRLRVASVVGKRTDKEATELISKVKERSDGSAPPLFISDNLDSYPHALLSIYGEKEEPKREKKRRRGRPRTKPVIKPPADLQYAQVVKHRDEHGRAKSIERRVVFGTEQEVKEKLEKAGCYTTISTAHVERDNLTSRQTSSRLVRKALSFSKSMEELRYHTALDDLAQNFSRYHASLRIRLDEPQPTRGKGTPRKWMQRTPTMAAGITDHRWTMWELMAYPIIKPYS